MKPQMVRDLYVGPQLLCPSATRVMSTRLCLCSSVIMLAGDATEARC